MTQDSGDAAVLGASIAADGEVTVYGLLSDTAKRALAGVGPYGPHRQKQGKEPLCEAGGAVTGGLGDLVIR
jgi:hypothetical protein